MPFTLKPLPYEPSAFAPVLSAESFDCHHGKHHQAYIDKINGIVKDQSLGGKSLIELAVMGKAKGDGALRNNAAQAWNHNFFWAGLAPQGTTTPSAKLAQLIESSFGSQEDMLKALSAEAVAHFASGWAWLTLDGDRLRISSLHDADSPILTGQTPLFTLDVWEHAYYIDYRNKRPDYAGKVLGDLINWDFVSRNLDGEGAARSDQSN